MLDAEVVTQLLLQLAGLSLFISPVVITEEEMTANCTNGSFFVFRLDEYSTFVIGRPWLGAHRRATIDRELFIVTQLVRGERVVNPILVCGQLFAPSRVDHSDQEMAQRTAIRAARPRPRCS
ncbi:MAG TPA: hypothetical protein VGX49_14280 [Jatrophihabitans sp.]|nr:hypothetical protein [Jatrophihabitans sp.]